MKLLTMLCLTVSMAGAQTQKWRPYFADSSSTAFFTTARWSFADSSQYDVWHGKDSLGRSMNPYAAVAINQLARLWQDYKGGVLGG